MTLEIGNDAGKDTRTWMKLCVALLVEVGKRSEVCGEHGIDSIGVEWSREEFNALVDRYLVVLGNSDPDKLWVGLRRREQ